LFGLLFSYQTSAQCDRSIWEAWLASSGDTISANQFVSNGIAHFPDSLNNGITTVIQKQDSICITSDFSIEVRLKNPLPANPAGDWYTGIAFNYNGNGYMLGSGCVLRQDPLVPGDSTITTIHAGTSHTRIPTLVPNLDNWTIIKLLYRNNVMHLIIDSTELFQLPYAEKICIISSLQFFFRESGSIDWVKISDANRQVVYFEDFLSCNQLVNYPACNNSPPVFSLGYSPPTCSNNTLHLNAVSSQALTYNWTGPNGFYSTLQNPVINNPTIAANGIYMASGSINICSSLVTTQTISVNFAALPVAVVQDSPVICQNHPYFAGGAYQNVSGVYYDTVRTVMKCDTIRITNLTVKPISFSVLNQTICTGQIYLGYNSTGTYIDTLTAANGCDSIRTLYLNVLQKPAPDLGAVQTICPGGSIILSPGQYDNYLWQDGSTQDRFIVKKPGLYSVTVSDTCGSASAQILIKEGICDVYFPSAFTPNNDGKNDLFKALGGNTLANYHLGVFNRWGGKVFETRDYTKGWDGSFNGTPQPPDVYVWYCEFHKPGNSNEFKLSGTVVLIR
jgi:gliding motility-associated-like protein